VPICCPKESVPPLRANTANTGNASKGVQNNNNSSSNGSNNSGEDDDDDEFRELLQQQAGVTTPAPTPPSSSSVANPIQQTGRDTLRETFRESMIGGFERERDANIGITFSDCPGHLYRSRTP
jgi:hypothetical protein